MVINLLFPIERLFKVYAFSSYFLRMQPVVMEKKFNSMKAVNSHKNKMKYFVVFFS